MVHLSAGHLITSKLRDQICEDLGYAVVSTQI
jgi:hypothetical protein